MQNSGVFCYRLGLVALDLPHEMPGDVVPINLSNLGRRILVAAFAEIAGTRLDQFGNMPGRLYAQIIRNLQIKYNALKPVSNASQRRAVRGSLASIA